MKKTRTLNEERTDLCLVIWTIHGTGNKPDLIIFLVYYYPSNSFPSVGFNKMIYRNALYSMTDIRIETLDIQPPTGSPLQAQYRRISVVTEDVLGLPYRGILYSFCRGLQPSAAREGPLSQNNWIWWKK